MNKKILSTIVFFACALIAIIVLVVLFRGAPSTSTPSRTTSAPLESINPASGGTTVNVVPATAGTPTTKPVTTTSAPVTTTSKEKSYTSAEVAKHADASSCWTIVRGKVYDLTSFVNQHDGGSRAILSLCGIDGTASFEDQHGGQRRPENELASLYIGVLSN